VRLHSGSLSKVSRPKIHECKALVVLPRLAPCLVVGTNLNRGATIPVCPQGGRRNTELDGLTRRPASSTSGMDMIRSTALPIYLQIGHKGTEPEGLS